MFGQHSSKIIPVIFLAVACCAPFHTGFNIKPGCRMYNSLLTSTYNWSADMICPCVNCCPFLNTCAAGTALFPLVMFCPCSDVGRMYAGSWTFIPGPCGCGGEHTVRIQSGVRCDPCGPVTPDARTEAAPESCMTGYVASATSLCLL